MLHENVFSKHVIKWCVYCSIISLTLELNVEDEYDVSIHQLWTLFMYWCHVCCLRFRRDNLVVDVYRCKVVHYLSEHKDVSALYKRVFCSSWLALTDPADVARVESKTVISTTNKHDTVPVTKEGVKGVLGNWIAPDDLDSALNTRFPGCMKGVFRLSVKHLFIR